MTKDRYAWSRRALLKLLRSNLSWTRHLRRPLLTTERPRSVMHSALLNKECSSVVGLVCECVSCLCADRGEPWERQTGAKTDLGWKRDYTRERSDWWEINSGENFIYALENEKTLRMLLRPLGEVMYLITTLQLCIDKTTISDIIL